MENITIGDIQHILTNFASIITAGGIVCVFALKVGKKVLDKSLQPFNDKMNEMDKLRIEQHEETKQEIKVIRDELTKNSLNTMKNTICNDNIPLSERISVGRDYIDKGGNGAVKVYLQELEEEYKKRFKGNLTN